MKYIYIGFAFLLFGNIIANIPGESYLLTAIGLGLIGCIVLAVGIYREYGASFPKAAVNQTSTPAGAENNKSADPDNPQNKNS